MHAVYIVDRALLQEDTYTEFNSNYCLEISSNNGPYILKILLISINFVSGLRHRTLYSNNVARIKVQGTRNSQYYIRTQTVAGN